MTPNELRFISCLDQVSEVVHRYGELQEVSDVELMVLCNLAKVGSLYAFLQQEDVSDSHKTLLEETLKEIFDDPKQMHELGLMSKTYVSMIANRFQKYLR